MATTSARAAGPARPAPARLLQLAGVFPEDVLPAPVAARPRARDPNALMQAIMLGQHAAGAVPAGAPAALAETDVCGGGAAAAQMPVYFYGVDQHPTRVAADCWQCGDGCARFPWFIPRELGSAPPPLPLSGAGAGTAVARWRCEGLFCTMACLKAWADLFHAREDTTYREVTANVAALVREVHGRGAIGHIWAAADARWTLARFARGRVSREEYRRQLRNRDARTLAPPRA